MKFINYFRNPFLRLGINIAYAVGNLVLGALLRSWWFISISAYYVVLSIARFYVLRIDRKGKLIYKVKRNTGILLIFLSFCLVGINILSAVKERGKSFHEIVMITIALYSFSKVVLAIIGMIKATREPSPIIKTLRNISLADAFVSIYSLQRSMLVSFPGLDQAEIQLFNILTGTGVWLIVLILGINLTGGKKVDMAKSKVANASKKAAGVVTCGYKSIEKGVVNGYKIIESGVVKGYSKIEDKFVEKYLTKDGETIEEAKERLKRNK